LIPLKKRSVQFNNQQKEPVITDGVPYGRCGVADSPKNVCPHQVTWPSFSHPPRGNEVTKNSRSSLLIVIFIQLKKRKNRHKVCVNVGRGEHHMADTRSAVKFRNFFVSFPSLFTTVVEHFEVFHSAAEAIFRGLDSWRILMSDSCDSWSG
jgi:hypothetical protein